MRLAVIVSSKRCYPISAPLYTDFTTPILDYLINFHYVLRHIAAAHWR